MNEAHASQLWRAATGLIWTRYDDSTNWVVFNPASANLHLITASAYHLWTLTSEHPRTLEDLVAALAEAVPPPAVNELLEATRAVLAFMDEAGLVYPELG